LGGLRTTFGADLPRAPVKRLIGAVGLAE
jgi:hypothetical protein